MPDGVSDVARLAVGGRPARRAVQPGARVPRGGRSGRRGRVVGRFGHRASNLQSLRPDFRPHRRDAAGHRRDAGRSAGRRARATTPISSPRSRSCGRPRGAAFRCSCSTGPTRSAGWCRATCSTRAYRLVVGRLAVPMRHGMTLGELARLAQPDLGLDGSSSRVVPVGGWRRDLAFDETGLPFIAPSPNLRVAGEPVPLSRAPASSRAPTSRSAGGPMRAVRADRRALAGHRGGARRLRAGRRCPGCGSGGRVHPGRPGDGKYADTLVHGHPARGDRPGALRPHASPRSTCSRRSAAQHPDRFALDPGALRPPGRHPALCARRSTARRSTPRCDRRGAGSRQLDAVPSQRRKAGAPGYPSE